MFLVVSNFLFSPLAREFANNPCFPPLIPPREGLLLLPFYEYAFYEYGQDKSRSWATLLSVIQTFQSRSRKPADIAPGHAGLQRKTLWGKVGNALAAAKPGDQK